MIAQKNLAMSFYYQKLNKQYLGEDNIVFWITGHSLGGALATLYTTDLVDRNVPAENIITYTFGAPPVGNDAYSKKYSSLFIHRLSNSDDPVSHLDSFTKLRHLSTPSYEFKVDPEKIRVQYKLLYDPSDIMITHANLDTYRYGVSVIWATPRDSLSSDYWIPDINKTYVYENI